jgi:hypothetical protein
MRIRTWRLGALATALAVGMATSASAGTINLGVISQGYTALGGSVTMQGTNVVRQDYLFTLSEGSPITIALSAIGPPGLTIPTGGSYPANGIELLYNGNPVAGTSSFSAQNILNVLGLYVWSSTSVDPPGSYDLAVFLTSNQANASGVVNFSGQLTSAVPEASTWSMMAFGFVALLFAGYRSRRPDISIVGA